MAEKGFGVKEINLIGPSGTPTITSPNNLNLNANNVAISTNVSIGGTLSVTGNVSVGGTLTYEDVTNIDSVGLITARSGLIVTGVTTTGGITIKAPTSTSVMIGQDAGLNHSGAAQCVGLGYYALRANTNSDFNTAVGTQALGSLGSNSGSSYTGNTAVGHLAGSQITTGSGNTLYGRLAGSAINSNNNTILGIFDGNQGGLDIRSSNNNIVLADGGGNPRLYINSSGNVGINQVSPASKLDVVGDVKATTFTGSGANLTNLPAATPTDSDIQVAYTVTANGSSAYRFAGNGVVSTADNPDIFLTRGVKYRFINNSGGSHPFQIRESAGGSAYSTGVTNNGASSGNIDFAPTFDSPSKLVYQCTSHGGMVGNIYMTGGVGRWIQQSIVTLQSGSSYEFTDIPADVNEVMIVFDGLSFDSNSNEIEFLLGHSGGYNTSNYIISASYEPGGNYQKRTTSIRFNGIGSSSYFPTGRLHLWKPVHSNNWWAEGICYPWETEGQYQHRVTGTAPSGGTLSKIKIQGSGGANFDNTGNGKIQLSYIRY